MSESTPGARLRVRHTTTYTYDRPVTDSLGSCHLVPRTLPWQDVDGVEVRIAPTPSDLRQALDHEGNVATYFQVTEAHDELVVEGRCEVTVRPSSPSEAALARPWEALRPLLDPTADGAWRAAGLALRSPLVDHDPGAGALAAMALEPGRPVGEAVDALVHRIHTELAYDPTATDVTSSVTDVLQRRAGVCQDFAHLALAGLRAHGLAARYVSGYLLTEPPPGEPRLVGADASHAWVAVWLGGDEWLAVDPTNDTRVGVHHVTVAWGRDYADVPPVKGVIATEATRSTLAVSVDVAPVVGSP